MSEKVTLEYSPATGSHKITTMLEILLATRDPLERREKLREHLNSAFFSGKLVQQWEDGLIEIEGRD